MRAYSQDLRERVLRAVVLGLCWLLGSSVRKIRRFLRMDGSSSQHRPVYPTTAIAIASPKRTPRPSISAAGL